uniref:Annexin n=1 Tax=Globodera pallida TaxID=36090 RepID=A0A183BW22_GLOPA
MRVIRAIRKAYTKLYNTQLEADIGEDTSGTYKRLLSNLCAANRDESGTVQGDKAKLNQNERDLIRLVVTRAQSGDLPAIGEELKKIYGLSLKSLIDSESTATTKQTLANLVKAYGGGNAL